MDGLDAALVRAVGRGLDLKVSLLGEHSCTIPKEIKNVATGIRRNGEEMRPAAIAPAMLEFGEVHARAVEHLLAEHQPERLAVVAAHGQTSHHQPPVSWQLLNPFPISLVVDCPVVSDLRQLDLAMGGEGAPITPLTDWIMFRDKRESRMIVNLGGFVNLTFLPAGCRPDEVRGGDVCICNRLLDTIANDHLKVPYDDDGQHAAGGTIHQDAAADLCAIFTRESKDHVSLNDEFPQMNWLNNHVEAGMAGPDMAATAIDAIARQIGTRVRQSKPDVVFTAGGGAHNRTLLRAIEQHGDVVVKTTDDIGVPVQMREAMAMAILGLLALDGVPVTLPSITGRNPQASNRVDGSWLLPLSAVRAVSEQLMSPATHGRDPQIPDHQTSR